jgi:hypothetical protein
VVALCNNLWFQLFILGSVLIDITALIIFYTLGPSLQDCFERDSQAEVAVTFSVIGILTAECAMRIFGHGLKFFTGASNIFDFLVVILSIVIALLKVVSDVLMDLRVCAQFNVADQCQYPNLLPSSSPECKAIQDAMAEGNEQGLGFVGTTPRLLRQIGVVLRLVRVVAGILRARRLRLDLQEKIRQAVAKKKRRYQRDGFDLDISYITDRCLAMSTPGFGAHKGYRNDMAEVSRFFNLYHYGKYRIYTLCEEFEGNYHPSSVYLTCI